MKQILTSRKNILLVDEDATVREALVRALTLENYQVVSAANAREACQKAAATSIDAMLFDLDRPDQHRWQTIRFLTTKNPSMSALGMTARSDRNSLASAAGLEALLVKPFDVPQLLNTLSHILEPRPNTEFEWAVKNFRSVGSEPRNKSCTVSRAV